MPRLLALTLCLCLHAVPPLAAPLVTDVIDGDTIVLSDGRKLRLAGIDAPEKGQPYAVESWGQLARMVAGQAVTVDARKLDKYGRTVAGLRVDDVDICLAMIQAGAAWHFTRYAHEQPPGEAAAYAQAELAARLAKAGLWADAAPLAPWVFRRPPPVAGARCGSKRTCKDMASCEEARHYLTQCGLTKLDRDGDGVPCEGLCSEK